MICARTKIRAVMSGSRRLHRRRRGLVLITAALALVALMGMAALTVDLGRIAVATQKAQSVADAAAMGAAYRLPNRTAAYTALADVVAANNASAWPPVSVAPGSDVTYYWPGDTVPDHGMLVNDEAAVRVRTHVVQPYTFARILGLQDMTIARTATAKLEMDGGGLPALFAGESSPSMSGITVNGSYINVRGLTHSNTMIDLNCSDGYFSGPVEYVHRINISGTGNVFAGGCYEGRVESYPVQFTWDQYRPGATSVSSLTIDPDDRYLEVGHTHVQGDFVVNGARCHLANGILLVDGNVRFNGMGQRLENVTIIAKGTIYFNGAAQQISPYVDGLSLMSLQTSTSSVITFHGANQATSGIIYAPNGTVTYNGASSIHQYGSIIGRRITVNGSHFSIYSSESGGGISRTVRLIR